MPKNIGLSPVKDFAKYILYTGFVENILYPVSGLILAPPERGKSSEVVKFEMLGAIRIDKVTAFGLAKMLQEMSEKDLKKLHHFIIPDLEYMNSMGREVRDSFLALIRGSSQEGMQKYRTFNIKLDLETPKKLGFLMCTTKDDLGDKRSVLRSQSFLSRLLPFSYNYGDSFRAEVMDFIEKEEHNDENKYLMTREEKQVVRLPSSYAKKLDVYAMLLAKRTDRISSHVKWSGDTQESEDDLIGIRAKEMMMSMLKAIALYHGRKDVIKEDFEEFRRLYDYMNFDFQKIKREEVPTDGIHIQRNP